MQAGFLLGPRSFYSALCALPESERRLFDMRGVGYINQLYGEDQALRIAQRSHARFVNTSMMLTTLGAAISDGLADGRVVSGVGGQYNFVSMAHALPGARSVLCARSTRLKDGQLGSNIVTSYAHTTIPRHLRDIAITEYGIADLRGRTDAECIAAMLNLADFALPGEAAGRCETCAQDRRGLFHPRGASPQHAGAAARSFRRAAARGPLLGVSLRHRPHSRGGGPGAGPAVAQGATRRPRARSSGTSCVR